MVAIRDIRVHNINSIGDVTTHLNPLTAGVAYMRVFIFY